MIASVFAKSLLAAGAIFAMFAAVNVAMSAQPAPVIKLTQTACQFVEAERGVDHRYKTTRANDCRTINSDTEDARVTEAMVLELKPGKYVFRVTNKNVPYQLGFWLRGKGLSRLTLPSVSGGGLATGSTSDFVIELTEGEYLYSCPLNPTPDYRLVVKS